MEKIVLGLSGGVDSAVTAALLMNMGYGVHGVYLDIGAGEEAAARALAAELGCSFESVSVEQQLTSCVKLPFAEGYLRGETPNPCVMCNPLVKFPALIAAAERIGAEKIATGHYARVLHNAQSGRFELHTAVSENDQSYMLCGLGQEILSRLLLPLGGMTKAEVRKFAAAMGLSAAERPDSMEICFIPDDDYAGFIERLCGPQQEGDFVDGEGNFIARHSGIHHYTIGQRRGLGVAAGKRVFVTKIDPVTRRVTLSDPEALMKSSILLRDVNWIYCEKPPESVRCAVRIRHSRLSFPAVVYPLGDGARVEFDSAVRAPVPGQAAVFYADTNVLGGGTIA